MYMYDKAHQGLKFIVEQLLTINIAHLSKSVVNLNLIIMFKPKHIFYFQGALLFFGVVGCIASGTLHFYAGFSVNALAGVEILV